MKNKRILVIGFTLILMALVAGVAFAVNYQGLTPGLYQKTTTGGNSEIPEYIGISEDRGQITFMDRNRDVMQIYWVSGSSTSNFPGLNGGESFPRLQYMRSDGFEYAASNFYTFHYKLVRAW
jgi:hypothetical protein